MSAEKMGKPPGEEKAGRDEEGERRNWAMKRGKFCVSASFFLLLKQESRSLHGEGGEKEAEDLILPGA